MSVTFACREVVQWLSAVEGHSKHRGISHPLTTVILAMSAIVVASVASHDVIFGRPDRIDEENLEERLLSNYRQKAALVLYCYVTTMATFRLPVLGFPRLCYEMLWSCNTSMILAAVGLGSNRPHLVAAAAISVAIDQLMWYVDLIGYIITRKWPIGVAKYLARPETTWVRKLSSAHHIFFLPLCLFFVGFPAQHLSQPRTELLDYLRDFRDDFTLMLVVMTVTAILSRFVTPYHLTIGKAPIKKRDRERVRASHNNESLRADQGEPVGMEIVLNINLVYEVWEDVGRNFPFLDCSHPYAPLHLLRLLAIWAGLNAPCAVFLACLSPYLFSF